MSWKKNAISYIMWFLYVLLTEALVLTCADELGRKVGLSVYMSALLAFAYAALVGLIVLLIRKIGKHWNATGNGRKVIALVAEAVICVVLLAAGLWLRVSDLSAMTQDAAYFEAAQVTYGQSIPQVAHGAVYLYLQALHGLFLLVGNHFVAGIWLQIALQMLAFLVLYFVVKKMAGTIAALITLAFGMCAPMMVQYALTLSPEMLYFFLVTLVLAIYMTGCGKKLHPALFMLFGALAAVMTYLDIVGVLLFLFAVAMSFMTREEQSSIGRKFASLACVIVSFAGVFAGSIFLDAIFSGKEFLNVLRVWGELYMVKAYVPSNIPFSVEEIMIIGLLVVGIFSFWCNKREEIISVGMWNIILLIAICFRFTEEMPGELYFVVILVVMAGAFVGQVFVFRPTVVVTVEDVANADESFTEDVAMDIQGVGISETQAVAEPAAVEPETTPQANIQFIENPLPLPKKHEKKVLDYAVELTDETAEFDIEVADDDDYDK